MANAIYDNARKAWARGEINWYAGGDTFRVNLLTSAYSASLTTHEFFQDIPAPACLFARDAGVQLSVYEPYAGKLDADGIVFPALVAGSTVKYIVIYKDSGADATSPLLVLIDTAHQPTGAAVLPYTTDGTDLVIEWHTSGIAIL